MVHSAHMRKGETANSKTASGAKSNSAMEGFEFVRKLEGIEEYTLTYNGMRVLLKEDHSAPVSGVMVTYHVGSRNETTGYTGATHLLEHLMFKGSDNFNK